MSKKDKSKFRKQLKAQILQDMAKFESQNKTQTQPIQKFEPKKAERMSAISTPKVGAGNTTSTVIDSEINLPQIKYDLKKTGIVVLGMAIVIAILAILDNKNNILLYFGNTIFKILHIQ